MQPFIIPSIFSAVDGFSAPVKAMGTSLDGLSIHAAKAERMLTGMTKPLSGITSGLAGYMGEAAAVVAVATAIGYTAKGVADYATEVSNLSAVTGATGLRLEDFKNKIQDVATETKRGMTYVAQAFTTVDNNMPELHKDADALAEVTKQAIILAKASRLDLAPAAEFLTMAMNQFGMPARDAAKAVDALAAGAVFGSSRIGQTAEALQVFGATAKNVAHMTFAESVALVELGSKFEKGTEAGTRFNRILVDMTAIRPSSSLSQHLRQYGVDVRKVSDTALPFFERLKEISKIKDSPLLMEETFGKRGIAMAAGLFSRVDEYVNILSHTGQEGFASQMADVNVNNVAGALQQLRDKWENFFITSSHVNIAMDTFKNTVQFVTEHLNGMLAVGGLLLEMFIAWKAYTWAVRGSLFILTKAISAVTFAQEVGIVMTNRLTGAYMEYEISANAMAVANALLSISFLGWVGIVAAAVAGVAMLSYGMDHGFDSSKNYNEELIKTKDGFVSIPKAATQATEAVNAYTEALKEYGELKNFAAHMEYERQMGRHISSMVYDRFAHPVLFTKWMRGVETFRPKKEDYLPKGADPAILNNPAIDSAMKNLNLQSGTQRIEVHINNNTNHDVQVDSTGAVAVEVKSTTGNWMGGKPS